MGRGERGGGGEGGWRQGETGAEVVSVHEERGRGNILSHNILWLMETENRDFADVSAAAPCPQSIPAGLEWNPAVCAT